MTAEIPTSIPDFPAVWLYDATGQTLVGQITTALAIQWVDQLNTPDRCSFTVPLSDPLAASIVDGSIVKFSYLGELVTGCQIRSEECEVAVDGDGNTLIVFSSQPGLLALLNSGTLLPEKGLTRGSDSVRRFGFMSSTSAGDWFDSGDWSAPNGYTWADDVSGRKGKPADFAPYGSAAYWLAKNDPAVSEADGTVQYFLTTFNTTDDEFLEFIFAFDDYGSVWIDGQQIVAPDYTSGQSWREAIHVSDYHLVAGPHMLCVRVENAPLITGHTNPVAFIGVIIKYDSSGNPVGRVNQTDLDWLVYTGSGEPGWHRGEILRQAYDEMIDLGSVTDVALLTPTFTLTADSNGDPYADDRTSDLEFPIGSTGLADMAAQLSTDGPLDTWVDAATMEWPLVNRTDATNRKGADKTGTVEFKLGKDGGNLLAYKTTVTYERFTSVVTQKADTAWQLIEDTTGVAAVGRRFTSMSLGGTQSEAGAAAAVAKALLDSAAPLIVVECEVAAYGDGPFLYGDCELGDTVKVPGPRGVGTINARLLGRSVDASEDVVKTTALLVEDRSL